MAVNLYGFNDEISNLSLMIRAESSEEAQIFFEDYIDSLNKNVLTDLQIKKEIPDSTLRASGFDANGIINGGDIRDLSLDDKALYINAVQNSYATTPSSVANSPTGDFTVVVNAKNNAWTTLPGTNLQSILSKDTILGSQESSYQFKVLTGASPTFKARWEAEYFKDGGLGTSETAASETAVTGLSDESLWLRATFSQSGGQTHVALFSSLDSPLTPYQNVVWTDHGVEDYTTFTLQQNTEDVCVGALLVENFSSEQEFNGIIYRVLLIPGLDAFGVATMDMNPNEYDSGFDWTSSTGEVWTLNGNAVIQSYD